ncbi:MAG TPA: hypoxanthine phosphoribosyltransferase [Candidatus Hydrogenedentes bacterium]|nr:hypoxanthine phosphoribosyltransferase [Candidatus Hydrogenedentota bacterium]
MRLIEPPLFDAETIAARVTALAAAIDRDRAGGSLLVIAVLKGAALFAADLVRRLSGDVCLDFIRARSYIGETSSGVVEIMHAPEVLIRDRHVLLVEDILDTGRTASQIIAWLKERGPASLRVCALIDKPARRLVEVRADYVGFSIEDHFVVGYGLDHNEQYRHLPSVYTLDTNEV